MKTISLNTCGLCPTVLHTFGYDANGSRVAERRSDGTLVFFVGGYYEYRVNGSETHTTKYYGSEVLRVDNDLRYILTDHLGSTSIVTDGNGENPIEQRYDAWGKTRYLSGSELPTDKEYTGQRHSRDIDLYDYKVRGEPALSDSEVIHHSRLGCPRSYIPGLLENSELISEFSLI